MDVMLLVQIHDGSDLESKREVVQEIDCFLVLSLVIIFDLCLELRVEVRWEMVLLQQFVENIYLVLVFEVILIVVCYKICQRARCK